MPDQASKQEITDLVFDILHNILDLQQNAIDDEHGAGLSIAELHVIEAVGDGEPHIMSEVARILQVTMPTLTGSVNRLEDKGFIFRQRSRKDRRKVAITLTETGLQAFRRHERFHERMIDAFLQRTKEEKLPLLMESIEQLRDFFRAKLLSQ